MARTRTEIQDMVELHTGRTDKAILIQKLCDNALKLAVQNHPFRDICRACDDIALTENSVSASLSSLTRDSGTSISSIGEIVTARIVEATKLPFTSGEHAAVAGDVITGASSSATAYVINVEALDSGSWAGSDAAGNLWITNKSGTFTSGEDIQDEDTNTIASVTSDPGYGGTQNAQLKLKNRQWWDERIINPEDNQQGYPEYGLHFGDYIYFDRPVNDDLTLRLRVSEVPSFAGDDDECPIACLDVFIEEYVTAMTFMSLGMTDKYYPWYILALGKQYQSNGRVGGSLLNAINIDENEAAEHKVVERGVNGYRERGITIKDLDNNRTAEWY